jgi:ribosomal protein S18 acetylase RimI-like enzyme
MAVAHAPTDGPAWLQDVFLEQWLGYPVFRLKNPSHVREVVAAAAVHPEWMIEARVAVSDVDVLARLTHEGFRVIDTNVQLTRAVAAVDGVAAANCRFAHAPDEAAVRAIAGRAFTQTRFHLDPAIPNAVADRIKQEWAGNFFSGKRGDWMVVAPDEHGPSGFLQLLRGADDTVVIDLIAVAKQGRGKGLARSMIAYAATSCLGREATLVVGTQIANVTSLRLYSSLGFRIASSAYVLHMHARDRNR